MCASTARVVPCSARSAGRSELRVMMSRSVSIEIPIRLENVRCSSPLGPFTWTWVPFRSTVTPLGISTGIRPMRDTSYLLPDLAQDLAAHAQLAGARAGHDSLGSGKDRHAQTGKNPRDVGLLGVNAAPGSADALDARQHGPALAALAHILDLEAQRLEGSLLIVDDVEALQEALILQDACDLSLDLGARHRNLRLAGHDGIADAG